MKTGFLADLHLHITDPLSGLDSATGFSIRTLDRLRALRRAIEIAITEGCEKFILGGDIYDKLNPNERLKAAFFQALLPYKDKIEIIIFPGNHDGVEFTHNYLSEQVIFDFLDNPPFRIISEPLVEYSNDGKEKLLYLPWNSSVESLLKVIKDVEPGLIMFGHLEIMGAVSSTEYTLTKGINVKTFEKFKKVLLGHYHRRQRLSKIVSYVGSPIIKDFSELGIEKGFVVYDSVKNEEKFFQLEERKAFKFTLSLDTLDEVDKFLQENEVPEGSLIKLDFVGTPSWIQSIAKDAYQIFNEFKPLKIKRTRTNIKEEIKEVSSLLSFKSRIDRIKEYSKDNPEFTQKGIDLYLEAQNKYMEVKI